MSERFTSIHVPGAFGCGIAEYGRRTPEEMIKKIRAYAEQQKADAERILATADSGFHIETYIGVHVHKNCEVIQKADATK